jgi:predicted ATPase
MRYISRIELTGFRSMHKAQVEDIQDFSVIFGKNDSGKSNVLRALNLFFNGETSPGQEFDPDLDICSDETRQRAMIKIWFAENNRYRSVGDDFWVRKTWSQKGEEPAVLRSDRDKPIAKASQFLSNFTFHYIPAIKSDSIFEHLLGAVYSFLTEDAEFLASLEGFASNVRKRTDNLTASLRANAGIDSHLAPPTDLESLFRTLDFRTGRDNRYSLLRQRGDGIKMRHIPELLSFISDNTEGRFHIWGFEEPENSLEFAAALEETEVFRRHAVKHQIFVTSHSPAFYNLEGDQVRRFYVSKSSDTGLSTVEPVKLHEEPASLMSESRVLVQMASRLKDLRAELDELDRLREEVAKREDPILFVEGKSDKIILDAAIASLPPADRPNLSVISAGGTTKMNALSSEGVILDRLSSSPVLVLVDNDGEGRSVCPAKKARAAPGTWHRSHNGTTWALLPFSSEYKRAMDAVQNSEENWDFTIEHIFPFSVVERAMRADVLRFYTPCKANDAVWKRISEAGGDEGARRRYFYKPGADCKVPFAEWVAEHLRSEHDFGCLPAILRGAAAVVAAE